MYCLTMYTCKTLLCTIRLDELALLPNLFTFLSSGHDESFEVVPPKDSAHPSLLF